MKVFVLHHHTHVRGIVRYSKVLVVEGHHLVIIDVQEEQFGLALTGEDLVVEGEISDERGDEDFIHLDKR